MISSVDHIRDEPDAAMRMIMKHFLGAGLLLLSAAASAQMPFDATSLLSERLRAVAKVTGETEPLRIEITTDTAQDGAVRGGAIYLSRPSIRLLHSQLEIDTLLASLIVLSRDGGSVIRTRPNVSDYLGLVAYAAAARAVDPIDHTDARYAHRREYDFTARYEEVDRSSGTRQGRDLLRLLGDLGSCSGAAIATLNRLAKAPELAQAPIARLASQARSGFGLSAIPPDMSCVKG